MGEHRFKNGYSKVKNPRKMVRLWAEKEMRNLKRLEAAGIRCPRAVEVRGNVLVMTFLGKEGLASTVDGGTPSVPDAGADLPDESETVQQPGTTSSTTIKLVSAVAEDASVIPAREHAADWEASPRLKDASLTVEQLPGLYIETLHILRRLWRVCKLVHADFSEYNILYSLSDGHLYTIDVSQSVEGDHPHAFDFLRADIGNVDEFFARRGVRTLGLKRTFELTVEAWNEDKEKDGQETEAEIAAEVERRFALGDASATTLAAEENEAMGAVAQDGHAAAAQTHADRDDEDAIFKQSYIPRNLNEVYDPERDVQRVLAGEKDQLIYSQTVGIVAPNAGENDHVDSADHSGSCDQESGSDSNSDSENEGQDGAGKAFDSSKPRGKRHEDKDAKRERKAAQKEEKREKRKEKMPKKEKNAKVKKTSGKNRK